MFYQTYTAREPQKSPLPRQGWNSAAAAAARCLQ